MSQETGNDVNDVRLQRQKDLADLTSALTRLEEERFHEALARCLGRSVPPLPIIAAMSAGMEEVGRLYSAGEYFLAELVFSSEIFRGAMGRVRLLLGESQGLEKAGRIVMGTVKGDIHDLGKNIVTTMLECSGFEVIDLGVDVPPDMFVKAIREKEPRLLGISVLLTTAFGSLERTIRDITDAGLRHRVRIMIGGAVTNDRIREQMGADFHGRDAMMAVEIARQVCR